MRIGIICTSCEVWNWISFKNYPLFCVLGKELLRSTRVVCYYTIPTGVNDLAPEAVDPYLCTHIIIGFATIFNQTISAKNPKDELVSFKHYF